MRGSEGENWDSDSEVELTAALTAGGRSSRFGTDKALATLEGQTLLGRVAQSLEFCAQKLLIAPPGKYALEGWKLVSDLHPGCGPLSGLETALEHSETEWIAYAAVDMPLLSQEVWKALERQRTPEGQAIVPLDARGRPQPLAALYSRSSLKTVKKWLEGDDFKMTHFLDALETRYVPWSVFLEAGLNERVFQNVNTKEDLERLT